MDIVERGPFFRFSIATVIRVSFSEYLNIQ